jgi:hypothetical protein
MPNHRAEGAASILLGVGIAANAILGPLVLGIIRIRESANMENQLLGGELTSLFVATPMAVIAGVLWWRGHALAPFVAMGPSGFGLYTYVQFVLVPDYSRYAGNNERYFPLYVVLVLLSWVLLWRAWRQLSVSSISAPGRRLAIATGTAIVTVNAAFALAWTASIAAQVNGPPTVDYVEHPTAFWLIRLMDLGFVIPIGLVTGIRLLRSSINTAPTASAFVGVELLLACAVAGMAIRMSIRGDPGVTPILLVVSTGAAVAFIVLYVLLLRSAVRVRRGAESYVLAHSP